MCPESERREKNNKTLNFQLTLGHCVFYQAAEIEESRRTSAVVVVRGCVSMGTGAPLLPQVLVVVHGVRGLIAVRSGTLSALLRRRRPHGFDKVHLVTEMHKPPVVTRQNKFSVNRKKEKKISDECSSRNGASYRELRE